MADDDTGPDGFELDDKIRAIRESDVLVVGFQCLAERLLIDSRRNDQVGPYVRVVQPVRSPQERLRQLRELRPGFNDPESFVFFPGVSRVKGFIVRLPEGDGGAAAARSRRPSPGDSWRRALPRSLRARRVVVHSHLSCYAIYHIRSP